MKEIKIYDFDFNLIASEFKCVLFEWDVRFNSVGGFKGEFTLDSDIYAACANKDFLVCVQGENQGIITSVRIENDRIVIEGKSLNFLLAKRICLPFSTKNDGVLKSAPELVCELVQRYCGDFMEVLSAPSGYVKLHFTRIEAKPVVEVITDLLSGVNLGHFVKFDIKNKKWIFSITVPDKKNIVLSEPDKTLSDCDYVRYLSDYAASGVYKQKMHYQGLWNASTNQPALYEQDKSNFAKAYKVEQEGQMFGTYFNKGDYIVCRNEYGIWHKSTDCDAFWHKITPKNATGAKCWESVLSCDDISEAEEMTLLNEINENVVALAEGTVKNEFKVGDIVKIQLGSGDAMRVFTKQVKRIIHHNEADESFVRPTFYKLKEREDE